MLGVCYTDGRGEEVTSPVYSEYTDENGEQWVVVGVGTGLYRDHPFDVRRRDECEFMTYKTDYEMEPIDQPLPDLMAKLARMQIRRALEETGGNKTKAAEMLGLSSYQTLSNWIDRYGQ